jgi:dTDP-4-amino-4,6-dideoxygalactose transaminase
LSRVIPYGHQCIEEDDIQAVAEVLKSDWITTGPAVGAFEKSVAEFVGAEYGTAVSSGTAALHTAMYAIGIERGDEVIVPAMTFAATANAVVFQGATPVFCDVDPDTLLSRSWLNQKLPQGPRQ